MRESIHKRAHIGTKVRKYVVVRCANSDILARALVEFAKRKHKLAHKPNKKVSLSLSHELHFSDITFFAICLVKK
jgi:hypothetical protein